MNRQELVKQASQLGIKRASSTSSKVLTQMVNELLSLRTEEKKQPSSKRGRPIVENSARQLRLMNKAQGLTRGKGRPVNENSARQLYLKAKEEGKIAHRGRPRKTTM
jgi:hypothetical protein